MKQTTKRFLGIAAASALVIGVATGAFGRGGFGPGLGGHQGMMGGGGMHRTGGGPAWMAEGDPVGSAEQRLSELKTSLEIGPDQEEAWAIYADAMVDKAALMASHRAAMHSGTATPDQRTALRQHGFEQMQDLIAATQNLSAVLTPEQQVKAGGLIGPPCLTR
jgi:hypothetical protein